MEVIIVCAVSLVIGIAIVILFCKLFDMEDKNERL